MGMAWVHIGSSHLLGARQKQKRLGKDGIQMVQKSRTMKATRPACLVLTFASTSTAWTWARLSQWTKMILKWGPTNAGPSIENQQMKFLRSLDKKQLLVSAKTKTQKRQSTNSQSVV